MSLVTIAASRSGDVVQRISVGRRPVRCDVISRPPPRRTRALKASHRVGGELVRPIDAHQIATAQSGRRVTPVVCRQPPTLARQGDATDSEAALSQPRRHLAEQRRLARAVRADDGAAIAGGGQALEQRRPVASREGVRDAVDAIGRERVLPRFHSAPRGAKPQRYRRRLTPAPIIHPPITPITQISHRGNARDRPAREHGPALRSRPALRPAPRVNRVRRLVRRTGFQTWSKGWPRPTESA